jgi:cytochrome c-type biogenesis protein CcmH/NrfF
VAAFLRAGKSDREILDAFVAHYGERILGGPEGIRGVVLTTVPIVVFICGVVLCGWFLSLQK